ncbi:MAG: hypothetical protein GY737_23760 [Desulfobacteraceae bacterium]|nr:hypothetical protein [Desulfobacteraceae bacterium]
MIKVALQFYLLQHAKRLLPHDEVTNVTVNSFSTGGDDDDDDDDDNDDDYRISGVQENSRCSSSHQVQSGYRGRRQRSMQSFG